MLVIKMSLFELVLGIKAKKPMDLAIPMGWIDHSKRSCGDGQRVWKEIRPSQEAFRSGSKTMWKTCQQNTYAYGVWDWATHIVEHIRF
jgi:hypothetical protein